ncbi:MAG: hypothetical protein WBG01_18320 [Bacteroidota bacterium]
MSLLLLFIFLFPRETQPEGTLREVATYAGAHGALFVAPECISGWTDGSFVVSDRMSYTLTRLNNSGTLLARTGSRGTAPGEFRSPGPLDCFHDRLAVADFASTRIQVFGRDLTHRTTFISKGGVVDLHYDPEGGLWVSAHTPAGKRLLKYDDEGTLRATLTPRNISGKPFQDVFLCSVSPRGEVFLAYLVRNIIEVWDTSGTFIRQFTIPGFPPRSPERTMSIGNSPRSIRVPEGNIVQSISMGPGGNLFVLAAEYAENPGRDVTVVTPQGQMLGLITLPAPASHIWINPAGHLFSIQTRNASVARYEFDGGFYESTENLR